MLFYVKIHVKIARLFIIVREFSSKVPSFILHGSNDSLELSYIRHRSNNHEASASMLRSDSVATLDIGHTVSTSFFSVCLTDQQHRPHHTNSSTKLGC